MNIALIGYGRMGREVERLAVDAGDSVVATFDIDRPVTVEALADADVCIEFSVPESVVENIQIAATARTDIVVGTTGWYGELDRVRPWFGDSALLYAQNFSIGVNVFYRILRTAARLMNALPDYDVYVREAHHRNKVDSPSGTAERIGEILLDEIDRKRRTATTLDPGPIPAETLQIASVRAGTISGIHTVGFDSAADAIELCHAAKNRTGFAAGALRAARWVRGRRGIYTMDDVEL